MTGDELSTDVHPDPEKVLGLAGLIDAEIQRHAGSLGELLTAEERIGLELNRLVREHKHRRGKVLRAVNALNELETPPDLTASSPAGKKAKRSRAAEATAKWRPSPEIVEAVLSALTKTHPKAQTTRQLQDATGYSSTTVGKALDVLREQERARAAGVDTANRGKPKLYAVMPTALPSSSTAVAA